MSDFNSQKAHEGAFATANVYDKEKDGHRSSKRKEHGYQAEGVTVNCFLGYDESLREKTEKEEVPMFFDDLELRSQFAVVEPRLALYDYMTSFYPKYDSNERKFYLDCDDATVERHAFKSVLKNVEKFYLGQPVTDENGYDPNFHRDKIMKDIVRSTRKSSDEYVKMLAEKGITKECPEERDELGILVTNHIFLPVEKNEKGEKTGHSEVIGTIRMFIRIKNPERMTEETKQEQEKKLIKIMLKKAESLINTKEVFKEILKKSRSSNLVLASCFDIVPMRSDYMKKVVGVIPFKKGAFYSDLDSLGLAIGGCSPEDSASLVKAEMDFGKENIITKEEIDGIDIEGGIIVH